jgi:hypothetical protein
MSGDWSNGPIVSSEIIDVIGIYALKSRQCLLQECAANVVASHAKCLAVEKS